MRVIMAVFALILWVPIGIMIGNIIPDKFWWVTNIITGLGSASTYIILAGFWDKLISMHDALGDLKKSKDKKGE
jgi:hypothetical protein